jgi:uncharacterized phage protein (TIGR01671 family)
MRTIKFRGKRTDGGGWIYGHYFTTPLTAEYNILPENGAFFDCGRDERRHVIADDNGCVFEVIPETVGQFTGLSDETGKAIYEGDIIAVNEENNAEIIVEFGCFCSYNENGIICLSENYLWCKVISNIHDDQFMRMSIQN